MKKFFIALLLFLPMISMAKGDIKLHCGSVDGPSEYEDSIVRIKFTMAVYEEVTVMTFSKVNERITIEWGNARLNGSPIAFFGDYEYEANKPKPDEVITAQGHSLKSISRRTFMPIVDKKKIKKEGSDYFYLILPIIIGSNFHDIKFKIFVTKE